MLASRFLPWLLLILGVALLPGCTPQSKPISAGSLPSGQEIVVKATEFAFSPARIQLRVGRRYRLVLVNAGAMPHDIFLERFPHTMHGDAPLPRQTADDAPMRILAEPGRVATIDFTPTAPGLYKVFCSITGHEEQGMKAVITVQ